MEALVAVDEHFIKRERLYDESTKNDLRIYTLLAFSSALSVRAAAPHRILETSLETPRTAPFSAGVDARPMICYF